MNNEWWFIIYSVRKRKNRFYFSLLVYLSFDIKTLNFRAKIFNQLAKIGRGSNSVWKTGIKSFIQSNIIRFQSLGQFSVILWFFDFAETAFWTPSGTITEHCLVPKSSSGQDATFGTKQCSVIVPEGTQIAISAKEKKSQKSRNSPTGSRKSVIWVPSGTITEYCLVPKSSSGQGASFGTKQCSVIVPEGTQITDFLLPVRDFLEFCDFFYFAEMAIWVPSAANTKHCLVPKSSSGQDATFGTKQCLVFVAEGTQIVDFLLPIPKFY